MRIWCALLCGDLGTDGPGTGEVGGDAGSVGRLAGARRSSSDSDSVSDESVSAYGGRRATGRREGKTGSEWLPVGKMVSNISL
jgi:hypothetical protein